MRINYTPEQKGLRAELRSYFSKLMTPDRREALAAGGGEYGDGGAACAVAVPGQCSLRPVACSGPPAGEVTAGA